MFLNQVVRKTAVIRTQAHWKRCACVKSSPKFGEIVQTTDTTHFLKQCITSIKRSIAHACDTSFFAMFHTRYVRWILLIHLTPPYGLILPGLAPGLPYKLGNRCLPALAGAMPPSPKQARVSKLPQALRVACSNGGNLAFPPARPPPSIVPPDIFGQSSIHLSIQTRAAAKASSRLTIGSSSIF